MKLKKLSLGIAIAFSLAACNSNKSSESAFDSAASDSVETSTVSDLAGAESKLVKTADLDFRVHDVYKTSRNIYSVVRQLGGLVTHNNIQTNQLDSKSIEISNDSLQVISSYTVDAEMTVRVPSASLDEFMQYVSQDATVISSAKLDVEDRSIDFLETDLKEKSRNNIVNKQLANDTLKTAEALSLANEKDAMIQQKMNNLRTNASVRYSTINLHFTQNTLVKKENLANNDVSSYRASADKRFKDAVHTGLTFFVDIIIGLSTLWPFLLLGLGGWMGYRYYQRRFKQKAGQAS